MLIEGFYIIIISPTFTHPTTNTCLICVKNLELNLTVHFSYYNFS